MQTQIIIIYCNCIILLEGPFSLHYAVLWYYFFYFWSVFLQTNSLPGASQRSIPTVSTTPPPSPLSFMWMVYARIEWEKGFRWSILPYRHFFWTATGQRPRRGRSVGLCNWSFFNVHFPQASISRKQGGTVKHVFLQAPRRSSSSKARTVFRLKYLGLQAKGGKGNGSVLGCHNVENYPKGDLDAKKTRPRCECKIVQKIGLAKKLKSL